MDQYIKVKEFFDRHPKDRPNNPGEIREMFDLHNDLFTKKEQGIGCGACRQRVYNNLKNWLAENKIMEVPVEPVAEQEVIEEAEKPQETDVYSNIQLEAQRMLQNIFRTRKR